MNDCDIAWLAGYLEGEGCFRIPGVGKIKRRPKTAGTPSIKVAATDSDVVERAARLMGCEAKNAHRRTVTGTSVFTAEVHGEKAIALMKSILPLMGMRRSKRIREVLYLAEARLGRAARGSEKPNSKLSDEDVVRVIELARSGIGQNKIAQQFKISQAAISLVVTRQTYKHVNTLVGT